MKGNTFFALDANAYVIRQLNHFNQNSFTQGVLDSNYYFQPYATNHYVLKAGQNPQNMSFSQWRTHSGQDEHTKAAFTDYDLQAYSPTLFLNATDNDSTFDLQGMEYLDLDSNIVCGNIMVPAYYSHVLIATGNTCLTNSFEQVNDRLMISAFPNPFRDVVTISFSIPKTGRARIEITSVDGRLMAVAFDGTAYKNELQRAELHSGTLASGMYFCRMITESGEIENRKLLLVR